MEEPTNETEQKEAELLVNESLISDLNLFASKMKTEINNLKELQSENIILKDESTGFTFSATSTKYDSVQLLNLGLDSFRVMQENKLKRIPLGVN